VDLDTKKVMAVVDKAAFHTAKSMQEKRPDWESKGPGLYCRFISLHLSFIEDVWRRLNGFLVPRHLYDTAENLKYVVLRSLHLLNSVEVHY
jgi:putative transposase